MRRSRLWSWGMLRLSAVLNLLGFPVPARCWIRGAGLASCLPSLKKDLNQGERELLHLQKAL